jgi:two-component system, cell cycle response regulator DivK
VIVLAAVSSSTARRVPLVLVVEDHDDTRDMYVAFLSSSFQVMDAGDAEQALAAIAARRPDLIITDLSLPGMDGFELIARVRRERATADIPVICLSGYGGPTHEEGARAAGCDRILQKPCALDVLQQTVEELLRNSAGGSSDT